MDIHTFSTWELEVAITHHNRRYWLENSPEITDDEYDELVEALRAQKPNSPVLFEMGGAGNVRHSIPMLSLEKAYSSTDVNNWLASVAQNLTKEGEELDHFRATCSLKVDGLALALRYDANGILFLALTRGDGKFGENITENALRITNIPITLDKSIGVREIRGEVVVPREIFSEKYCETYRSARNLAVGFLRRKFPSDELSDLRFLAYDMILDSGRITEIEKMQQLKGMGFDTVPWTAVTKTEDLDKYFRDVEKCRDDLEVEVDGVVFKIDSPVYQNILGSTAHHPRWAIAQKFRNETAITTLTDIEWQVSRLGVISPVAVVEPVTISGANISKASLHNLGIMRDLGSGQLIPLKSKVVIARRGEIIPHIDRVIVLGTEETKPPANCPSCGADTYESDGFLCAQHDPRCESMAASRILHYCRTLDLDGFGPAVIEELVGEKVGTPSDLYDLQEEDLVLVVGEKRAKTLLAHRDSKLNVELGVFLTALGVPRLGGVTAFKIAEEFGSLSELMSNVVIKTDTGPEEFGELTELFIKRLCDVEGVGRKSALIIAEYLAHIEEEIERLALHVDTFVHREDKVGPWVGKVFLFTGTLKSTTRAGAREKVVHLGGDWTKALTKQVTHLVVGDDPGSKLQKAKERGATGGQEIIIWDEQEFLDTASSFGRVWR